MKISSGTQICFRLMLIVCLTAGMCVSVSAQDVQQPKILLVHSYHAEYAWVEAITAGVRKAIEGKEITLEIAYMDTKRNTSQEYKTAKGREMREKIDFWKPDVVITADDNAQLFVAQHYAGKKPYFVFCGVNSDPAVYGFPAPNVTGVIERPQFTATVDFLREIVPNIRKIAVISEDDPTSVGTLSFMQEEKPVTKILGYHVIGDFEVWKERVRAYNVDADALCIYTYHTIKGRDGGISLPPKEIMDWTVQHCTIPTVGMLEFAIEDGVLCGVVESGFEHGYEAAKMAVVLIEGADISTLPIKRADVGLRMLNLTTAKRLGIGIPESVLASVDRIIE